MKRSAGITFAAVIALVGSIFMFLFGILMLVVTIIVPIPTSGEVPASPTFMRVVFSGLCLMYLLPAGWGIATSVGLFRLRNWARISMIVFGVLLVLMGGFSGLVSMLIPLPPIANGNVNPAMMLGFRMLMGSFWLSLVGIGVWWLVFFTRPRVRAQFATAASAGMSGVPAPPPFPGALPTSPGAVPAGPKRPLSITIIAWIMLVGCILMPLGIVLHAPLVLFTKLVTGWTAAVCYLGFAFIHFFTGRGLLSLRPWARQTAIGLYAFAIANSAIFHFAPGGHARVLALMESQSTMFPWGKMLPNRPQAPFDPGALIPFFAAIGLVAVAVPLYFLITRKAAFDSAALKGAD